MKTLKTFLFILVTVSACQQATPPSFSDADVSDIDTRRNIVVEMVKSGDYSQASEVYASDCIVLPPNMEATVGIDATVNSMTGGPTPVDFSITNDETEGNGTYAIATGTWVYSFMLNDTTQIDDHGKYVEVWKKQEDGTWRLYRDIWNSSVPMN